MLSKIQPVPSDSSLPLLQLDLDGDHAARSARPRSVSEDGAGVGAVATGSRTGTTLAGIDLVDVLRGDQQPARPAARSAKMAAPARARPLVGTSAQSVGPRGSIVPVQFEHGVTVVGGGGGALGSAVVARLAASGATVVVPARHPGRVAHQAGVTVIECDLDDAGIGRAASRRGRRHRPPGAPW